MDAFYNTKEGIQGCLSSMEDFTKLVDARHEAGYERKERLNEFFVVGRWYMDACGNTMCVRWEI